MDLDAAIDEALRHDPNERLATAQELRRRVEASLVDHGGLAGEEEVAELVQELMADDLAQMRQRARSVVRLRSEIADITADPGTETGSSTFGTPPALSDFVDPSDASPAAHGPSEETTPTGTHAALTAVTASRRPRTRLWVWGAALLVGGLASLAFTYRTGWLTSPASPAPAEPVRSSAAESTAAPVVSVPALPATTALPEAPRGFVVEADADMAQLVVDGKAIILPEPTREVALPAGAKPPGRLVALTADGRRVEAKVAPDQRRVTLDFPEAARVRPRPAVVPYPTPKKGGGDDELADSPYGAQ